MMKTIEELCALSSNSSSNSTSMESNRRSRMNSATNSSIGSRITGSFDSDPEEEEKVHEEKTMQKAFWTIEEDKKLLEAKQNYPKKDQWNEVTAFVGTKNGIQVKKRWDYLVNLQRKIRKSKLSIIDTLHQQESTLSKKDLQQAKPIEKKKVKTKENKKKQKKRQQKKQKQQHPTTTTTSAPPPLYNKIQPTMEALNETDYSTEAMRIVMDPPPNVISLDDEEEDTEAEVEPRRTDGSEILRYRPLISLDCRCRCAIHGPSIIDRFSEFNPQLVPSYPPWYRPYQDRWSLSFSKRLCLVKRVPCEVTAASAYDVAQEEEEVDNHLSTSMVFHNIPN